MKVVWYEPVLFLAKGGLALKFRPPGGGEPIWWTDVPIGAVSSMAWEGEVFVPTPHVHEDGLSVIVRCPGGHPRNGIEDPGYDWYVDAPANNCTRRGEPHRCWVRHGDPRDGTLHVDKNGDTCAAGAGSIVTPRWHGFLHGGQLRSC
ncbi:MAG: hypothetical protein ABW167_13260 [Baekduia sp.]